MDSTLQHVLRYAHMIRHVELLLWNRISRVPPYSFSGSQQVSLVFLKDLRSTRRTQYLPNAFCVAAQVLSRYF